MIHLSSPSAMTRRKKKGFSLLEAAIVLGVVGLVIGGIWAVYSSVRASMQSNRLHQQTLNLVGNLREYYTVRALPAAAGSITTAIGMKGLFPEEMCPANCVSDLSNGLPYTVRNAYGGATTVWVPNLVTYPNQFYILHTSVDKKGCMELGMKLSARAPEIGLVSFTVVGTYTTFPIPLATLKAACPGNSVTLYFKTRM